MGARTKEPARAAAPRRAAATPRALGYRMPAEWAPHEATWLAWPHNTADWPGRFAPIPWIYADIVRLLAGGEDVRIVVQDAAAKARVRRTLERNAVDLARIELYVQPTDRVWTRDSGPIFVQSGAEMALVDFRFNAWAKYDNWTRDDRLPAFVAKRLGVRRFVAEVNGPHGESRGAAPGKPQRLVLEGGSIDVDGAGAVLTTEECLLSPVQARNPGQSREAVEDALREWLGVDRVLWLGRGIAGDDTHGHVDDTARFANERTIVACVEPDVRDDNHAPLADNLARIRAMRTADGRPYEIAELPMPRPVVFDGQRLPASYANFYVANAGVLVPVFNDPNDRIALDVLAACFRDRPVIPVYCRDLVWGLGTLHCMTQQQPASPR